MQINIHSAVGFSLGCATRALWGGQGHAGAGCSAALPPSPARAPGLIPRPGWSPGMAVVGAGMVSMARGAPLPPLPPPRVRSLRLHATLDLPRGAGS